MPNPLEDDHYDKLGGWLLLPALLQPVLGIGYSVVAAFDTLKLYSDKLPLGSQLFVLAVGLGAVGLAIGWLAALYYASTISPIFPRFYIWMTVVSIAAPICAMVVSYNVFGFQPETSDWKELGQSIFSAFIWVPYMLVSKRVKATFYGIPFPQKPPRSAFSNLDPKSPEERRPNIAPDQETLRYRKKGNRLGILLTLLSILLLVAGAFGGSGYQTPAWAGLFMAVGLAGTLFGYLFARLWYWYRAA